MARLNSNVIGERKLIRRWSVIGSLFGGVIFWMLSAGNQAGQLFSLFAGGHGNLWWVGVIVIAFAGIGAAQYRFTPAKGNLYGILVYALPFTFLYFAVLGVIIPTF